MYQPSLEQLRHNDVFEAGAVVACNARLGYPEEVDPGVFMGANRLAFLRPGRDPGLAYLPLAPQPTERHSAWKSTLSDRNFAFACPAASYTMDME